MDVRQEPITPDVGVIPKVTVMFLHLEGTKWHYHITQPITNYVALGMKTECITLTIRTHVSYMLSYHKEKHLTLMCDPV